MRLPLLALFPAAFALLAPAPERAFAHAIISGSSPAAGATVKGPAVTLTLRYNSRIDQERSRLTLIGPDGKPRPLTLQPADAPDTLSAKASGLRPGAYKLHWQVLAIDGHITRGDIPFHVTAP
ncbi:MAG TPA: copper resistance CopC family protein [Stellaceae bacterium]|nr:copper resistance CopC family protein [Stellaceae bacterium]